MLKSLSHDCTVVHFFRLLTTLLPLISLLLLERFLGAFFCCPAVLSEVSDGGMRVSAVVLSTLVTMGTTAVAGVLVSTRALFCSGVHMVGGVALPVTLGKTRVVGVALPVTLDPINEVGVPLTEVGIRCS